MSCSGTHYECVKMCVDLKWNKIKDLFLLSVLHTALRSLGRSALHSLVSFRRCGFIRPPFSKREGIYSRDGENISGRCIPTSNKLIEVRPLTNHEYIQKHQFSAHAMDTRDVIGAFVFYDTHRHGSNFSTWIPDTHNCNLWESDGSATVWLLYTSSNVVSLIEGPRLATQDLRSG